jgi:hypothetical protein
MVKLQTLESSCPAERRGWSEAKKVISERPPIYNVFSTLHSSVDTHLLTCIRRLGLDTFPSTCTNFHRLAWSGPTIIFAESPRPPTYAVHHEICLHRLGVNTRYAVLFAALLLCLSLFRNSYQAKLLAKHNIIIHPAGPTSSCCRSRGLA